MKPYQPFVIVLGPNRNAVSGVSTHLNLLFDSALADAFTLIQFQVGSEGRQETLPGKLWRLMSSPFALALQILRRNVTAVHINTSMNASAFWRDLAYLLIAKLSGTRIIYQIHGGESPLRFCRGNRLMESLLRTCLRLPDAVVVLSQFELASYRRFVPGQEIVLLPNSIDITPYAHLKRDNDPLQTGLRLVYIGRLARAKGLHDALGGMARAQAKGIQVTLVIAGSGPDEEPLRQRVRQLGLDHTVRFVGPLFDTDKLGLYEHADVLMLATYHAEGLPYALLESMAAGVPAITTRIGGIPDVMVDNVHGIFVPPHDEKAICRAIEKLANDPALLAEMSDACRRRIAHSYTIERMAGNFSLLYSKILTRHANMLGRT